MSGLQDVSFIRWQLWTHRFTAPICSPWQLRYLDLPDQLTHYSYMRSQGPWKFVFKAVEAQNAFCSDVWMSRSILHSISYCFSILLAKIAWKYKYFSDWYIFIAALCNRIFRYKNSYHYNIAFSIGLCITLWSCVDVWIWLKIKEEIIVFCNCFPYSDITVPWSTVAMYINVDTWLEVIFCIRRCVLSYFAS